MLQSRSFCSTQVRQRAVHSRLKPVFLDAFCSSQAGGSGSRKFSALAQGSECIGIGPCSEMHPRWLLAVPIQVAVDPTILTPGP